MKKIISLVLSALLLFSLASCGGVPEEKDDGKINVVVTIFPAYDWVREIADGTENLNLELLCDSGVDMHSFQPSVKDVLAISSCDVFIYVGGESDEWVDDALENAENDDMIVIDLLDVLGDAAKTEETVEGMQSGKKGGGQEEYDEHVWLSLRNAKLYVNYIADILSEADGENAKTYVENAEYYAGKLDELDKRYETAANNAKNKVLVFADRFPFRYLFDDYGLSYCAAFEGCSAETEASFETIVFLTEKVDELGLEDILITDGGDGKLAETVAASAKSHEKNILSLDSMQSVTKKDMQEGETYLSVMEKNLSVLKTALG